jgi:ABC-2 type transport system permease protein
MNSLRVFFRGGVTSYRALFAWLTPWVAGPMMIVTPLFQLLFFAYLGRASDVASDTYFVVGNALLAAALPGLWGMSHSISGERRSQTLGTLLSSPASRLALFMGRALPTIANGFLVSAFCFVAGGLLLDFDPPASALPALALAILVCAFSCAGLGICVGAFGLRGRNVTVLSNLLLVALLLLCGANVPLERLPDWMEAISPFLPLTHGIESARELVAGQGLAESGGLLMTEAVIALAYAATGFLLLRVFEYESRRTASLETM